MRGRVSDSGDFPEWIRSVIALRQAQENNADVEGSALAAIDEARRFGTALVGDISNTGGTSDLLAERGLPGVVFYELLGFKTADAPSRMEPAHAHLDRTPGDPHLRHSLAAHAPYSVSPALFRAIRHALKEKPYLRASVHLGESEAELEFLLTGTGPWRRLLDDLGAWDASWRAPKCHPLEYVDRMGFLDDRLVIVHGVKLSDAELQRVAMKGATLVTCPRGNLRTGAGTPPIEAFFESGARIAVGTDSLASVPDLDLFAELAEMRRLAYRVPARTLLEWATINGARALGFDREFGTIEPGKSAAILVIDVADAADDVEEHLVSGIEAAQVRWLDLS